jgi:hypothetical protein
MKIGMFTANYMDRDLESVFKLMAEHGYEKMGGKKSKISQQNTISQFRL